MTIDVERFDVRELPRGALAVLDSEYRTVAELGALEVDPVEVAADGVGVAGWVRVLTHHAFVGDVRDDSERSRYSDGEMLAVIDAWAPRSLWVVSDGEAVCVAVPGDPLPECSGTLYVARSEHDALLLAGLHRSGELSPDIMAWDGRIVRAVDVQEVVV